MTCSKQQWCSAEPIVEYRDDLGKQYCVFHAPQCKKGVSLEEFNRKVLNRIDQALKRNEICYLDDTIFEGDISFVASHEIKSFPAISFAGAEFNGKVIFGGEDAYVTFTGEVFFSYAMFKEYVDFSEAGFSKTAYFYKDTFLKGADFTLVIIENKIRFEQVNLSQVIFADTNLSSIDFINCNFAKKNNHQILYDEILLYEDEKKIKEKLRETTPGFFKILKRQYRYWKTYLTPEYKEKMSKVEMLYRQLKQKYKKEYNEQEVSRWHYREKEMFRRSNPWRRILPSLTTLYWVLSGYAEKPIRSGIVLVLLIIIISLLFGVSGIRSTEDGNLIHITKLSDIGNWDYLRTTLEYATFEPKPAFIPSNWLIKLAAKLLIPFQFALLALAIRNRLRR